MGKRFTETSKWGDKWFRALGPYEKLGWQYLCDNCDAAGVIDLDRELADFQIGHSVEWDTILEIAGDRIEVIKKGKWWLTGFIEFQYGKLSAECKAHRPIFASLKKHSLEERVSIPFGEAINSLKDKEKEKEKDKEKEGGAGDSKRFKPPTVDQVREYCTERKNHVVPEKFINHYESNGWKVGKAPMKDWKAAVRTWEQSDTTPRGSPSNGRATTRDGSEILSLRDC